MELAPTLIVSGLILGILWVAWRGRPPRPAGQEDDALPLRPAEPAAEEVPDDPRCGNCRYIVRGIPSLTCPECGRDLREVGINVGRRAGGWRAGGWRAGGRLAWLPSVVAILVWTGVVNVAWRAGGEALERAAPRVRYSRYTINLSRPASGAYNQLKIDGTGDGRTDAAAAGLYANNVTLRLIADRGAVATLTADLEGDTYGFAVPGGPAVTGQKGFGPDAVRDWLARHAGRDDPKLAAEAAEAVDLARALPDQQMAATRVRGASSNGSFGSNGAGSFGSWSTSAAPNSPSPFASAGGSYSVTERQTPTRPLALLLGALAVWLAGTTWLLLRIGPGRRSGSAGGADAPIGS